MADLANIKSNIKEEVVVTLKLGKDDILNEPKGDAEATPMTITLSGPNSKASQEVAFDIQDEAIAKYKADPKSQEISSRKMFELRVDRVARNTTGWNITLEGKSPKFTLDAVKAFYNEYKMFFYQVEEALEIESGFTLA